MKEQKLKLIEAPRMSVFDDDDNDESNAPKKGSPLKKKSAKSSTPLLDSYGQDLTNLAKEGKLDPVVGRKEEIERLSQILSRRKKNNPILIGESGTGKSTIIDGLAQMIIEKKVSRVLFDKRIVTLDLASLVAGTKYRGQFEERMKGVIDELKKNPDIIIFLDEIHTIIGAGGASGSMDAANMVKPALARGELQCIGATTLDEYREHIEKDGALERRFQKITISPTTEDDTIIILNNIKEKYEDHHSVTYTDEAIKACVTLTERYITNRNLPDKAIDALDETGSRVHISNIKVPKEIQDIEAQLEDLDVKKNLAIKQQDYEGAAWFRDEQKKINVTLEKAQEEWEERLKTERTVVTEEDVAEVVSMMTGIPLKRVEENEMKKLSKLSESLSGKVIGQDHAVEKVAKAIKRNRAGLKDPNKPIASLIFIGDSGSGKTLLAKKLSEELFDGADKMIRIDMSEYMEKFSVSRLIGAPPGYVGYEKGGELTEKVRRNPYSVVLLDEIEKAHDDVYNLLLQIMDEGHITDSLGRKVDFKNTVIIMTSNVGVREVKNFGKGIGFNTSVSNEIKSNEATLKKALNKKFSPEFLNRIDDTIIFNSLTQENIRDIIHIELEQLRQRTTKLGYELKVNKTAIEHILENGFDKNLGARPLKRAIQKYVEDPVSEAMVSEGIEEGSVVTVSYSKTKEDIVVKVKK